MDALRGAMPAVECPRCGETFPPTDAPLATCARCGLVFRPHEVQHPHRPPAPPEPPPGITVTRTDDTTIIRWPLPRIYGVLLAVLAIAAADGAYLVRDYFWYPLGACAAIIGYLAALMLVNSVEVVITRDHLIRRYRPLRLLDSRTLPRRDVRAVRFFFEEAEPRRPARYCVEVGTAEAWLLLAATRRGDHARYLRDLLAQVCELVPR
jgi:hypothetical protein